MNKTHTETEARFRSIAEARLTMLGVEVGEDYLPKETPPGTPVYVVDANAMVRFADDRQRILDAWPIVPFSSKSRDEWESIAEDLLARCQTPALRQVAPGVLVDRLKDALPI